MRYAFEIKDLIAEQKAKLLDLEQALKNNARSSERLPRQLELTKKRIEELEEELREIEIQHEN